MPQGGNSGGGGKSGRVPAPATGPRSGGGSGGGNVNKLPPASHPVSGTAMPKGTGAGQGRVTRRGR